MASNVKIVSDGTPRGTQVLVDGKLVQGVESVSWSVGMKQRARVTLYVKNVELEYEGPMTPAGDDIVLAGPGDS